MITRHSSRTTDLRRSFLSGRLQGTTAYDRIAGYFRSSVLEAAGEELDGVAGPIRMVCNGDLDKDDVEAARKAMKQYPGEGERVEVRRVAEVLLKEWKAAGLPHHLEEGRRYRLLSAMLRSGRLEVRVMPRQGMPFLHAKAGVIRRPDGDVALCRGHTTHFRRFGPFNSGSTCDVQTCLSPCSRQTKPCSPACGAS